MTAILAVCLGPVPRARDIVGHTAIVMMFTGTWMLLGLALF